MIGTVPDFEQAAFDAWFFGGDGRKIVESVREVLFDRPPNALLQADFLVGSLRLAFQRGFVAGRAKIRPNFGPPA
jgi:hypothetical protein